VTPEAMPELTDIMPSLTGLPWPAVFGIVLLTVLLTRGPGAFTTVWNFFFDREKYRDGRHKQEQDVVVTILEKRIAKLEEDFKEAISELKQTRSQHVNCEIEQERLRGQINVLTEKVARLEGHDKANADQIKGNIAAIVKIDPSAAADLLPSKESR